MAGVVKTFAVGTVCVVGLIAAPGTTEAESDAKQTGAFIIGTTWTALTLTGGAFGEVFGGEQTPTADPPATEPVADTDGDGQPG
jgi:hypothetical protein